MNNTVKASILGVGTELTSGQISNTNATWISQKLKNMGLQTDLHLVVPDNKTLITDGLQYCASKSDLIFITGGLGPTTDDFTRDLISQWSNLNMEFDLDTWEYIQERLKSRGVPAEEFQKQQCYFPKTCKILKNSLGTAHGFYLFANNKHLFALPGPPREIESIWNDHIQSWLNQFFANIDPYITLSWDILGKSEGELAKITEKLLAGSGLEIGYRVHMPYVEVKVSFYKSERNKVEKYINLLEQNLSPLAVSRQGEDIANKFCEKLMLLDHYVHIHDEVSNGYLLQRLQPYLKANGLWKNKKINFSSWMGNNSVHNSNELFFKLELLDQLTAKAFWQMNQGHQSKSDVNLTNQVRIGEEVFTSVYPQVNMEERRRHYFAERALLCWLKALSNDVT